MSKTSPKCPIHQDNPKRAIGKKKRELGYLAMEEKNMDQMAWAQKHDPLFKIKGKKRHRLSMEMKGNKI